MGDMFPWNQHLLSFRRGMGLEDQNQPLVILSHSTAPWKLIYGYVKFMCLMLHAGCCNPRLGYWSQGREEVFSDFLRLRFQDILRLVHLRFFYGDSYDYMYGVGVNDIWCSILLCHVYSKPGEAEQSSQTKTFVFNLNLIHFFSSLNDKQLN